MPAADARFCMVCGGGAFVDENVKLVDGRYALERELGRGAMGVVHLARDIGLERDVAVKMIAPELAASAEFVARFRREAAMLASVRDNHVVQAYSFGAFEGSYFLAMEFVRGRTLEELIEEYAAHQSYVSMKRALTIVMQIAGGLAAAHAAGVVHRDVKPSNIVIEDDTGRPVLIDFGLAYAARRPGGPAAQAAGTPAYMAPEQWSAVGPEAFSPAVDVYGLACTAFDLFANRPPFAPETVERVRAMHAFEDPPRLSSIRPELAPLDPVLARGLAKQPELRHESCAAMREALEEAGQAWLRELPAESEAQSTSEPPALDAVRVLVIDDDEEFRRFALRAAQIALFGLPVRVSSAATGRQAIELARRSAPELVILDFDMPGFDGIETLSALRALPGGTRARVVVASARAGPDERWKFAVLGVSDFVTKPVQLPVLVDTLTRVVGRAGLRRAAAQTVPSVG